MLRRRWAADRLTSGSEAVLTSATRSVMRDMASGSMYCTTSSGLYRPHSLVSCL